MTKFTVLEQDGVVSKFTAPEATLPILQELVGGYIELVNVPEIDGDMYVNEEGLLMGLELNEQASFIARQIIVGDAVIVWNDDAEDGMVETWT